MLPPNCQYLVLVLMTNRGNYAMIGAITGQHLICHTNILNCLRAVNRIDDRIRREALINISRCAIEHTEHRDKTIRCSIRAANKGALGADIAHMKTDAAGILADKRALL